MCFQGWTVVSFRFTVYFNRGLILYEHSTFSLLFIFQGGCKYFAYGVVLFA
jgi:hypothetical protein